MTNLALSLLLLALVSPASSRPAPADVPGPRLRGIDDAARRLVDEALRRSTTVRQLATRIERSNLIVYVQLALTDHDRTGFTKLLTSSGDTRFVLVDVNPTASRIDVVARLGHELRHVVEIADAPEVRDDAGMRSLFERIGWRSGYPSSWETEAAIAAGRQVYDDLWARPARPTVLARAR